ncbi:MAG: preprotein translocase subunit SecE [Solirubrobacterales bacterium]
MARNRKRAKQRKAKRQQGAGQGAAGGGTHHEDVPGALEHASGEVEEFDAALVAGADGKTADEGTAPDEDIAVTNEKEGVEHPEALSTQDFAELEDRVDEIERTMESGDRDKAVEEEEALDHDIAERRAAAADSPATPAPRQGIFGRLAAFLRASWSELQRVQWPDRRQVGQATAVVLGFVVVAGVYLGVADALAQRLVNLII